MSAAKNLRPSLSWKDALLEINVLKEQLRIAREGLEKIKRNIAIDNVGDEYIMNAISYVVEETLRKMGKVK